MPFYAGDPNRFTTTWQTDPSQGNILGTDKKYHSHLLVLLLLLVNLYNFVFSFTGWQNQFIQQLPTQTGQTTLDYQGNHTAYATSPHYQANTTYTVQNVATTFDVTNNTYYQAGIQSVPAQRPPSNRGAYTPVPSPRAPHYTTEYQQQYAQQASTPGTTSGNDSRPASAASYQNSVATSGTPVYTVNQQNYERNEYQTENSEEYSNINNGENTGETNNEGDRQEQNTTNGQHSGNAEPGYLQGSNGPRASLDCSGYSGSYTSGQYADNSQANQNDWQQRQWQHNQRLQNQQMQNQQIENQQQIQNQQQQLQNQQIQNQRQQIQNQQQLQNQQQQIQNQQQQMQNQQQQQLQSQQMQNQIQSHQNQMQQNHQMQQQRQEESEQQMFSQSDRVNLNSRLKTMILNKQNHTRDGTNTPPDKGDPGEGPPRVIDDRKGGVSVNDDRNTTGHFLSYSHHLRDNYRIGEQVYPAAGNYAQTAQAYGSSDFGGGGHHVWEGGTNVPGIYDKHASKNVSKTPQKLPSYADVIGQYGTYSNAYEAQKYAEVYGSDSLSYTQDSKDFQSRMLIGPVSEMNQQNSAPARDTNVQNRNYDREAYDAKFRHPSAPLIPKLEMPETYQYPKNDTSLKNDSQRIANQHQYTKQNEVTMNSFREYPNGIVARSQQNTVLPPISTIKQENFGQKSQGFQNYQQFAFEQRQEPARETYAQIPRMQENLGFQKYNRNFTDPALKKESDNRRNADQVSPVDPKPPYYIEQIKSEHSPPGHKIYKNINYGIQKNEPYLFSGEGGPVTIRNEVGYACCRQGSTKKPPPEHLRDGACLGLQTKDEVLEDDTESTEKDSKNKKPQTPGPDLTKLPTEKQFNYSKEYLENLERLRNNSRTEVPDCNCFPADKNPPEPGSYYTHLGMSKNLNIVQFQILNTTFRNRFTQISFPFVISRGSVNFSRAKKRTGSSHWPFGQGVENREDLLHWKRRQNRAGLPNG